MLTQQLTIWPSWKNAGRLKIRMGWVRLNLRGKVKVAAATTTSSSPSYSDAFAKQLKKQQQQFDALMGKVQAMVTKLQSDNAQATSSFHQGDPSLW